ncbi:MAG: hypothetical protein IKJ65_09175 [Clostridia bacterium]|nr:hypothetical protein [Clostridia bacterium]
MSLAAEHFKALCENVNYQELKSTEKIQAELRRVITDTQQLTLSQMDDSLSRQLGSILFSHEAGLISALSAINPPEIKWRRKSILTLSSLFALLGTAAGVGALILIFNSGKLWIFLLAFISVALFLLNALWPREKPTADIYQSVNAKALFMLAERRMEAIDRDLEAYLNIPGTNQDEDEGVLQLITKAVGMKREDPDSVPDELMTAITALSIARGYSLYDYNGENDEYFDVMPTIRQTRTIVPALVKNGRVLSKGLAIEHTQELSEE